MATYTLDTHATIKQLEDAGMDSRQAEAVVAAISRSDAELATKADLKTEIAASKAELKTEIAAVKAELKTEIAAVKAELKQDIADLKANMLKVAMGVAIAIILANATMTIALIRFLS
ncbi:MAG: hypothetical protein F4X19_08485 [Acidobacteria bacterium]|nr:hypothetical protein [Acidobacteriota bacterium]